MKQSSLRSTEAFYQFSMPPFQLTPDPTFIYKSRSYINAKRILYQFITTDDGVLLVDSKPGLGKTVLLKHFSNLPLEKVKPFLIQCFNFTASELLESISYTLKLKPAATKSKQLMLISLYCKQLRKQGLQPVFIFDEADYLSSDALNELGILMCMNFKNKPLFQLILAGNIKIELLLAQSSSHAITDKIIHHIQLLPLKKEEVKEYVEHRIRLCGGQPPIMPNNRYYEYLHRFSEGSPRIINLISYRLLLLGSQKKKNEITFTDFHTVIHALHNEGLLPLKKL